MSENQENTVKDQNVQNEKKKNPQLRLIIFAIELIVLIAGVVGSVIMVRNYNDPQRVAESYFNALKEGDYATAYSYLKEEEGMDTSEFLSVDVYAAVMERYGFAEEPAGGVSELYDETHCVLDAGRGAHTIQVTETGKKKWFFFSEYEVCPQEFYAENVYITAPKMMTVSVNGIELNSSNSTRDDHSTEVYLSIYETAYKIDKMIVGDYRIQVSGDIFQTYTEDVTVNTYYNIFMMDTPELEEGTIDQFAQKAPEMVRSLCQSALNGEDVQTAFAAAGLPAPTEEESGYYDTLISDFEIDDGYFTQIELSEFDPYSYGGYFDWDTGEYRTEIAMNFSIAYSYDQLDWWSGAYYESKEDASWGHFSCDLIHRNGEWVLEDVFINTGVYIW